LLGNPGQARKPAADIFLFDAGRMAVPPARCLVIEDSVAGVPGPGDGMTVLGHHAAAIAEAWHAETLRAAGAARTFDDIAAIADAGRAGNRPADGRLRTFRDAYIRRRSFNRLPQRLDSRTN